MKLQEIDFQISRFMKTWSRPTLKLSFAIIFIWFGILKPLGVSEAAPLVLKTVSWMPVFSPTTWLHIIGYWEVLIGLCFLTEKTTRIAILLLFMQMGGTFLPLFILPEIAFQPGGVPFLPTMAGQYIIKNLMIISAALVVGGRLAEGKKVSG